MSRQTKTDSMGEIFTKVVAGDHKLLTGAAMVLLSREDLPSGSSFAITTDRETGVRTLWLTDSSYNYLILQAPGLFI